MYKKLFSETIIYGIGTVLPRLISFLLIKLFGETINPEEFSIYSNLYAYVSVINVLLTFGFETSFFRFSAEKGKEKLVFSTSTLFLFFTSILFLILIYIFITPIANTLKYEETPQYIKWFALIIFLDTLSVIPFAWLRFNNKPLIFTLIKLSNSFILAILTIIFLKYYLGVKMNMLGFKIDQDIAYTFVANFIASLFTLILLSPIILKVKLNFNTIIFKRMIQYSFPIMLAGLAYIINENFDKMIQPQFENSLTKAEIGAYGMCYKLAALMTIAVMAFRMGVEPFYFKQMNNKNAKIIYANILEIFIIVGGVIVIFLLANLEWLKLFFIKKPEYYIAMKIVPIIIIANYFFGIYTSLSVWYKVIDKTIYGTLISWFGAIFTLFINIFLINYYGFMASAWASLLAYGIMMMLSYFMGQKLYKIPYKIKKIALYMLLAILLGTTNYYIFNKNLYIGNIFLLFYIFIIYYLEKNHLLKTILHKE